MLWRYLIQPAKSSFVFQNMGDMNIPQTRPCEAMIALVDMSAGLKLCGFRLGLSVQSSDLACWLGL